MAINEFGIEKRSAWGKTLPLHLKMLSKYWQLPVSYGIISGQSVASSHVAQAVFADCGVH